MSFLLLAIRVTHSEVIESLETDSVINTLRRFISRRGMPKMIRSDNGTNLSSGDRNPWACKQLESAENRFSYTWRISSESLIPLERNTWEESMNTWFVLWERSQDSFLSNYCFFREALRTLVAEVQGILNGRPTVAVLLIQNHWLLTICYFFDRI